MADAPAVDQASSVPVGRFLRPSASVSLREFVEKYRDNGRLASLVIGALLFICLIYCVLAPRQYEAHARLALKTVPATPLPLGTDATYSGSFASGQVQLETLAGTLRSDQLAWSVILGQRLYRIPAFMGRFAVRFPDFHPESPSPEAQLYLLERFADRLRVGTVPRTLLLDVRFRCGDPVVAASVVNALIEAEAKQETGERGSATSNSSDWLRGQLDSLRASSEAADQKVAEFEKQQGILANAQLSGEDGRGSIGELPAERRLDDLSRELMSATADRILREAEYRAAQQGNPEQVLAGGPNLQNENSSLSVAALRQIHSRHSDLEQELAQLSTEHGPNYPRSVEIRHQLADLDRQLATRVTELRGDFMTAWETSLAREQQLRRAFDAEVGQVLLTNPAIVRLQALRRDAEARRSVYFRVREKLDEANLAAGAQSQSFNIVDAPHVIPRPVSPNWLLDFAVTLFLAVWGAFCAVYLRRSLRPALFCFVVFLSGISWGRAQAPTPSTSGLPTGVARIPAAADNQSTPNPSEAPLVWSGAGTRLASNITSSATPSSVASAPISTGDLLEVSEFRTPEFHSMVRVSERGMITLPMIGDVAVVGMDEGGASQVIATKLIEKGILLHPQVFVLDAVAVGREISVLGEVSRPGVYAYGVHHRLLDAISESSGLNPTAGTVVYISHRDSRIPARTVVLDPSGTNDPDEHNPSLEPGDTVQVTRAGLVYVIGDVIRPGGFTMDLTHSTTLLQALSLAWGPTHNAALTKALLIREQQGGRTVTKLDLKRMLRGLDPDIPVQERDIVYVPDSAAKNLLNRTMESVVQSAAGVSIYSGLVYSQRY